MNAVLTKYSASISKLKKNPTGVLKEAGKNVIAIFKRNQPVAYIVPAEIYEELLDKTEDYESGLMIRERQNEKSQAFEVLLNEL
jgi:antitoxin StbD